MTPTPAGLSSAHMSGAPLWGHSWNKRKEEEPGSRHPLFIFIPSLHDLLEGRGVWGGKSPGPAVGRPGCHSALLQLVCCGSEPLSSAWPQSPRV